MKKKILAMFMAIVMVIGVVPIVNAEVELVEIDLSYQNITDEQLSQMVSDGTIPQNVTILYLVSNQISDITPLSGLTNLEWLGLDFNQISDITPLSGLTNLEVLGLGGNQISDITPLSGLTNLGWLYLFSNQISDIVSLVGLTNLRLLDLNNNQISDLTPLSGLTNLSMLFLWSNQITLEQVNALQKALPDCRIEHDAGGGFKLGHVTGGDKITITDALEVLKHLAGISTLTGNSFEAALITPQSQSARRISIGDVLEILKHLAGISIISN
jgi:hypothetical protein